MPNAQLPQIASIFDNDDLRREFIKHHNSDVNNCIVFYSMGWGESDDRAISHARSIDNICLLLVRELSTEDKILYNTRKTDVSNEDCRKYFRVRSKVLKTAECLFNMRLSEQE